MAKVLLDDCGIDKGLMTTIHAYTTDQQLLDQISSTARRSTCAGPGPARINIIPTSTGAAKAIALVLPELKGKLDGYALRVPVPTGSVTDLTVDAGREVPRTRSTPRSRRPPTARCRSTSSTPRTRSSRADIVTDPASCIFDAPLTLVIGNQVKVVGWYDNEWGYSNRLIDLSAYVGELALTWRPGSTTLVDQLGDVRGKRVLVRSDLNVPLDGTHDHRRRADPRQRADHPRAVRRRRPRRRDGPPRPPEGRAGGPLLARARWPRASVSCSAGRRLRRRHRRAVGAPRRSTGCRTATSPCWRTSASTRARPARTTTERGAFADQLAALADAFVSDGFGVVHRKQASVYDVALRLPARDGRLVATEIDVLRRLTVDPARPYVVVLGGSKVSDKLGVIDNLLGKADRLLIGGGMVFTFLKAQGHEVGKSLLEDDQLDTVPRLPRSGPRSPASRSCCPTDIVVDTEFPSDDREPQPRVVPADEIPADSLGLDIGPESARAFAAAITDAQDGVLERPDGRLRDRRPSPTAPGPWPRR